MNEADIIAEYDGKFSELSRLKESWDLFKVPSKSHYDGLTKKILDKLYKGNDEGKISLVIESELCITYGFFITEFDPDQLAKEVMAWWTDNL